MKKANMLRKNKDFSYCYRRGKRFSAPLFTIY
ncbi:MAG: ribonuclease P protein component, partial [Clostridia bacterium]|nr:ribonuclease P protein component [Clostridia bacterium]